MKHPLQRINEEAQDLCSRISTDLRDAEQKLNMIADEQQRVTELSGQAAKVIDQIDLDFKVKTKLSNKDITLLFLATALQCARQYLLSNEKLRLEDIGAKKSNQRGDELMKHVYETTVGSLAPKDWEQILFQSVPYDAVSFASAEVKASLGNLGLSGSTHRYRTLGHDPVLGWVFGTANILTDSLTRYDFQTFSIQNKLIAGIYPGSVVGMTNDAIDLVQQDQRLLIAAIARQAIHFGSDYFTKQGLPVPGITVANNALAKTMIDNHIDLWSVSRGATIAALINQIIATLHQLFYQESKDGVPALYEVRTRKILSYSNLLASGSNVIVSAVSQDATKLDVGGMLVTIYRIVTDYQFIHQIKKDFLKNQLYDKIVGSEYDFMKGDS